ncbi:MAG: hypothetical protein FJ104_15870, partial [Deltaproteobacteria bacterium]|nr:hypothetical protein [Deltaproteobacteria bacterium]
MATGTSFAALAGGAVVALLLAGTAGAAGGTVAPNADGNSDGVFDNLAAQVAPLAAGARVNVIVRLDGAPDAARVAALQAAVGSFSVGRSLPLVDGLSATV